MITREDLQRLHQRAVGNSRRYYADGRVNDLVAAVGEYLNQDDPTVEIAYLRATIGDLKAGVIPGQNSEQPERVKPHRDTLALAIARSKGHVGVVTVKDYRCADAILALLVAQPTVAEARAQALRDFRRDFGRKFSLRDPYGWFDRETMSACHRQIEGLLDAAADCETEGGAE